MFSLVMKLLNPQGQRAQPSARNQESQWLPSRRQQPVVLEDERAVPRPPSQLSSVINLWKASKLEVNKSHLILPPSPGGGAFHLGITFSFIWGWEGCGGSKGKVLKSYFCNHLRNEETPRCHLVRLQERLLSCGPKRVVEGRVQLNKDFSWLYLNVHLEPDFSPLLPLPWSKRHLQ